MYIFIYINVCAKLRPSHPTACCCSKSILQMCTRSVWTHAKSHQGLYHEPLLKSKRRRTTRTGCSRSCGRGQPRERSRPTACCGLKLILQVCTRFVWPYAKSCRGLYHEPLLTLRWRRTIMTGCSRSSARVQPGPRRRRPSRPTACC